MRYLISAMLVVVGLIHLLPLPGVLGSAQLSALYGIAFDDPNLVILMRHRAVLFGLLGLYCLLAALRPRFQASALAGAWISVVSFLALAWSAGGYSAPLARVVAVDLVALACLVVGTLATVLLYRSR